MRPHTVHDVLTGLISPDLGTTVCIIPGSYPESPISSCTDIDGASFDSIETESFITAQSHFSVPAEVILTVITPTSKEESGIRIPQTQAEYDTMPPDLADIGSENAFGSWQETKLRYQKAAASCGKASTLYPGVFAVTADEMSEADSS